LSNHAAWKDQLLTDFTPKLRFGNDFNRGWLVLSPIAISSPASVEPRALPLTQVIYVPINIRQMLNSITGQA